ncbi:MAG: hypothetical protein LH632_18450 [Rhodoferax sp.]|nr:hypothetical protein [Rhodoferax sp.]
MKRRTLVSLAGAAALGAPLGLWTPTLRAADGDRAKFQRIPTQFIAALADPMANSGGGAQSWGLWPVDPGPRGVALGRFAQLLKNGGVAPEGWKFDSKDWWLEEHGRIMEPAQFPARTGKFLVTGERDVVTSLTIHPVDGNGDSRWELGDRATLYDVTHLGCRAARYTPAGGDGHKRTGLDGAEVTGRYQHNAQWIGELHEQRLASGRAYRQADGRHRGDLALDPGDRRRLAKRHTARGQR